MMYKFNEATGMQEPVSVYLCEICGRTITWYDLTSVSDRHCWHVDRRTGEQFIMLMTQIYPEVTVQHCRQRFKDAPFYCWLTKGHDGLHKAVDDNKNVMWW